MKNFKHFIYEQKNKGTLTIFDIDETLFHTKATIKVVKNNKIVHRLDNQAFNTYKLKPGESYDFGEFRDAKLFRETSTPVDKMIAKARHIVKNSGNPNSRAIIVTARADFNDRDMFLHTFRDHGIPIDKMYVERAGNLGLNSPATAKKHVFRKYLDTDKYNKIRLYDDALSNLTAFLDLQNEYPNVKFEAWLVNKTGNTKKIT